MATSSLPRPVPHHLGARVAAPDLLPWNPPLMAIRRVASRSVRGMVGICVVWWYQLPQRPPLQRRGRKPYTAPAGPCGPASSGVRP